MTSSTESLGMPSTEYFSEIRMGPISFTESSVSLAMTPTT